MSDAAGSRDLLVEAAETVADALAAAGAARPVRLLLWRRLVLRWRCSGLWGSPGDLADDLHDAAAADPELADVLRTLCSGGGKTGGGHG